MQIIFLSLINIVFAKESDDIEMRKPTHNEIYMYKNLLWLSIGVFVFVPVLSNCVLQLVVLFTDGNIAYGETSTYVAALRDIIVLISHYIGMGTLVVCLINFGKNAIGVIFLAFISHLITFVTSMTTYLIYGGDYFYSVIFMFAVDMLVNAAVYLVLYLFIMHVVKKKNTILNLPEYHFRLLDTKDPVSFSILGCTLIYGAFEIGALLYRMIGDFIDPSLGPPVNTADTLYWVLEYVTVIVGVTAGYFIMLGVYAFSNRFLRFKKKYRA